MPLLTISIKNQTELVQLNHDFRSQHMRIRQIAVIYGIPVNPVAQTGIHIDLNQMVNSGMELTGYSSAFGAHQSFYLPRPSTAPYHVVSTPSMGIDLHDLPREFNVAVYNDDATRTPAVFDQTNVHEIVLYLEHLSHDQVHG
jgi:hypothetical protein